MFSRVIRYFTKYKIGIAMALGLGSWVGIDSATKYIRYRNIFDETQEPPDYKTPIVSGHDTTLVRSDSTDGAVKRGDK